MNIANDDRVVTYYIVQSKRLTDGQYTIVTKAKKENKRFQLVCASYDPDSAIASINPIGTGSIDAVLEQWFMRSDSYILSYAEAKNITMSTSKDTSLIVVESDYVEDKNITVSTSKDTFLIVVKNEKGEKILEMYINVVD